MINELFEKWIAISDTRYQKIVNKDTYIEAFVKKCIITFRGFEYCTKLNTSILTTNEYIAYRYNAQSIMAAIDSVERELNRTDYLSQNLVDYETRMHNIALSALHHINTTRLELA